MRVLATRQESLTRRWYLYYLQTGRPMLTEDGETIFFFDTKKEAVAWGERFESGQGYTEIPFDKRDIFKWGNKSSGRSKAKKKPPLII